jgi:hypothetical protein
LTVDLDLEFSRGQIQDGTPRGIEGEHVDKRRAARLGGLRMRCGGRQCAAEEGAGGNESGRRRHRPMLPPFAGSLGWANATPQAAEHTTTPGGITTGRRREQ